MADAQRLEKELKLLRSTVDRLSNKVKENDELLRKCLYNENKFELQLALVKDQLTTFIEQKVFIQFSNLNQQFNSKFEKVNATIADLKSDLEKYNQDIKDDQIIRRSQLETIYEDRLSKEFEIHMEKFKTLILSTMKSLSAKQEDRLRKDLTDVMIGHVALKETELEGKIQEKLSENTKNNNEKLKVVILDYMKNTTMSYQEALRARVDQYLQDKVDELQNNVYQYVDKELKEITKKYHEQLRDDCEKEISDSLTEKKNQLTKIIVETLKAKFQQQRQELLESLITYINKKAEIHKTDILTNILTECNHRFYEINEELKINTKFVIDQEMKIQKHDLIEEFKMSNAKSFDFLSDKLHQLLSEEFDSEMKIIGSELRGHTELWQQTSRDIQALNTKFVEKIPYLLKTYQSEMKWQLTGIKKLTENVACQQENVIESQPFLIEDCGLQMMAKLKLFESGPVLLLGFVQDNSPEKKIYYHRRTTILMDQSGIDPPKDRIRISEPHFGKDEAEEWMTTFVGCRLLDSFTTLKNKNNLYVKDDSVIIKILIHPLSILYQSYASDNGILLWKIEDFAKKKRDEKDEVTTCHMSDYFYSSKNGYRLQAQLHLHTRYLMIMVNFLRGEWDEFLPKFFPHKTTVTLLDQSNAIDKVDFEKSLLRNDTCNDTFNKYYLKDKLAESIYLKNDCLLVKVAIQPMCALSSSSELEYPQDSTSSSRLQDSAFFR